MEEKYGKSNEKFWKKNTSDYQRWKTTELNVHIPDFKEIQEILWKPNENKAIGDSWENKYRI